MDYREFRDKYQNLPVILTKGLIKPKHEYLSLLNQIGRWQKKGLVIKLKRGVYMLNPNDRKINPSRLFVANQLYSPSYVSLEYALGFYGLIPEQAFDLTSVLPKKRLILKTSLAGLPFSMSNRGPLPDLSR